MCFLHGVLLLHQLVLQYKGSRDGELGTTMSDRTGERAYAFLFELIDLSNQVGLLPMQAVIVFLEFEPLLLSLVNTLLQSLDPVLVDWRGEMRVSGNRGTECAYKMRWRRTSRVEDLGGLEGTEIMLREFTAVRRVLNRVRAVAVVVAGQEAELLNLGVGERTTVQLQGHLAEVSRIRQVAQDGFGPVEQVDGHRVESELVQLFVRERTLHRRQAPGPVDGGAVEPEARTLLYALRFVVG